MNVFKKLFAWLCAMSKYPDEQESDFKGWDMIPGGTVEADQ